VSKKFGEWYQKTNKTEDTNKLTLFTHKIISILHKTLLETVKIHSGMALQKVKDASEPECVSHVELK
jgi:hypothetical protein